MATLTKPHLLRGETETNHIYVRDKLENVTDPASQVKVQVRAGHLLIHVHGEAHDILLPDDVVRHDCNAEYHTGEHKLVVTFGKTEDEAEIEKNAQNHEGAVRDIEFALK